MRRKQQSPEWPWPIQQVIDRDQLHIDVYWFTKFEVIGLSFGYPAKYSLLKFFETDIPSDIHVVKENVILSTSTFFERSELDLFVQFIIFRI